MARTIPKGLSGVLEELELERPQLVKVGQNRDEGKKRRKPYQKIKYQASSPSIT